MLIKMIDSQSREWHVQEREDGSVTIYYTRGNEPVHYVVWDSIDAVKQKAGHKHVLFLYEDGSGGYCMGCDMKLSETDVQYILNSYYNSAKPTCNCPRCNPLSPDQYYIEDRSD